MPRRTRTNPFSKVRNAEREYATQLRKIAKHIDDLVRGLLPETLEQSQILQQLLNSYSNTLTPWAQAIATRMLGDVSQRDLRAWKIYTKEFGRAMHEEITRAPTGLALQEYLRGQVELITSLPTEAGERVHDLVLQGLSEGSRGQDVVAEIMRTGQVTKNRANLIAYTECARASAGLTMVRAQSVGSDGYIWRSVKDAATRPTHRAMDGKFVRWDSPPEVEPNKFYHAGMIYNCRCFMEPVLPEIE